jgi:hypothetical protein
MTAATKALQGVDSGALAAQYRQCSAWTRGVKSMEMNTKESAFNMFAPFASLMASGYSQWNIDTGNQEASFAPLKTDVFNLTTKKFNFIKLAFIRFFSDINWGNHGKSV